MNRWLSSRSWKINLRPSAKMLMQQKQEKNKTFKIQLRVSLLIKKCIPSVSSKCSRNCFIAGSLQIDARKSFELFFDWKFSCQYVTIQLIHLSKGLPLLVYSTIKCFMRNDSKIATSQNKIFLMSGILLQFDRLNWWTYSLYRLRWLLYFHIESCLYVCLHLMCAVYVHCITFYIYGYRSHTIFLSII